MLVAALELLLQQQLSRVLTCQRAARVDLADRDAEQVRLEVGEAVAVAARVMLAEQQGVEREQIVDLLRPDPGGVLDVPAVHGVRVPADLHGDRAGDE